MHALRNQVRPKHQVLVLKCYPRHQKNNLELKPNSSELSYLLYYASTRRSKLQKVVEFLDKRASSDVWNVRIGKVSVTLQILRALIEKCPKDLPLYAAPALRIFKTVLNSLDVTMIEETLPTWATFCEHQDPAILAADQEYIRQYEEIIRIYASFASKDTPIQHKTTKSLPVRIRFRKAGLGAIHALAESEALSSETGRQLSLIVPVILENIYDESGQYLLALEHREEERHEIEKELALKRRQSTVLMPNTEAQIPDPVAASGTTEVADRLAEQETGAIALQALKQIFAVVSRSQLRLATLEVLRFMGRRIVPQAHFPAATVIPLQSNSWPCMLFAMICSWTPVQDRHVILVSAIEELVQTPLRDDTFECQYVLATITGWLLSSDVNFIGLSIMDVLMAYLGRISELLNGSSARRGSDKASDNGVNKDIQNPISPEEEQEEFEGEYPASASRSQLLAQLQRCIGCLAVHIYYSEQISDMITAILSRIRPSANAAALSPSTTNELAPDRTGSTSSLTDRRAADLLFVSDQARLAGLRAIKEVLVWANWKRPEGSTKPSSRSFVPVHRWDGTQWLLRENNWEVRVTYVEVLMTWMHYELGKPDLRVREDGSRRSHKIEKKDANSKETSLARRAVSNASNRDISPHRPRSTFLALLHLAAYDNALQYSSSEGDLLLLHLLLSSLIAKMGVNALQHGLPMIKKLQDDISDFEEPASKIQIASLVHGYLWATSVNFHFDASATGRLIAMEISMRMKNGTWLQTIRIPPMPLEEVAQKVPSASMQISKEDAEDLGVNAFEKFDTVIDKVAEGYEVTLYSPPSSPPTSPLRKFSTPMLEQTMSMLPPSKASNQLPSSVKDNLLSTWSRESVISANSKLNDSQSGSMSGSPTANGSGKHLSVQGVFSSQAYGDMASPRRSHAHHTNLHVPRSRNGRPHSAQHTQRPQSLRDAFNLNFIGSRSARASQIGTPLTSSSSIHSAVKVEDLKKVLKGEIHVPQTAMPTRYGEDPEPDDSATESMISYEGSEMSNSVHTTDASERRVATNNNHLAVRSARSGSMGSMKDTNTEGSITPRPLTASSLAVRPSSARRSISPEVEGETVDIPPVPPLPDTYASQPQSTSLTSSMSSVGGPVMSPSSPPRIAVRPGSKAGGATNSPRSGSIKSQNVRESLKRSISTRDGAIPAPKHDKSMEMSKSMWNALDLLESIESESVGPIPGTSAYRSGTGLRPPY